MGLARIGRAVKRLPAMGTTRRAAQPRLGLVNLLQERPYTGVGKDGVQEKSVRHWGPTLEIWSSPADKPPGALIASSSRGTNPKTSAIASVSAPESARAGSRNAYRRKHPDAKRSELCVSDVVGGLPELERPSAGLREGNIRHGPISSAQLQSGNKNAHGLVPHDRFGRTTGWSPAIGFSGKNS